MNLQSNFIACLIGGALGDALGAPVEKRPTSVARDYLEAIDAAKWHPQKMDKILRSIDSPRFVTFGQITDDTQLSVALAESILSARRFSIVEFSSELVRAFKREGVVGSGWNTRTSVDRLDQGIGWFEAGGKGLGNGSAMRAAPIGLYHAAMDAECRDPDYTPDALLAEAFLQSIGTHPDTRCCLASAGMAFSTYFAVRLAALPDMFGEVFSAEAFTKRVARCLRKPSISPNYPDFQVQYPKYSPEATYIVQIGAFAEAVNATELLDEDALEWVLELQDDVKGWEGITPLCTSSFLWSLYSFLRHPHDYKEAVALAIWPGGDVDSTASMTGQLVGALNGESAIPIVQNRLYDREASGIVTDLRDVAVDLHAE